MLTRNNLFSKYEELEAFMVLANELQKEINNIIFLNQRRLSEQNLNFNFSINFERKHLFQLLMNIKDANEINTIRICLGDSNDINDSFLESISNARIALSKVVVETIDNSEKCVEHFKNIKKYFLHNQSKAKCSNSLLKEREQMADSFLSTLSGNKTDKCRQFDNKVFKPPKLINLAKNDNTTVKQILSQTENDHLSRAQSSSLLKFSQHQSQQCSSFNIDNNSSSFDSMNDRVKVKQERSASIEIDVSDNPTTSSSIANQALPDDDKEFSVIKHVTLRSFDDVEFSTSYLVKRSPTNVKNKNKYKANAIRTIYYCLKCSYKTEKIPDLKIHLLNHQFYEGSIKCRYCVYYASNGFKIKQHEIKQHPEYSPRDVVKPDNQKFYSCKICPYDANNLSNFKKHLSHHAYQEGALKCRYCPYYLTKINNMITHEILHPEYKSKRYDK